MIRIAVSQAAFEGVAAIRLGRIVYEPEPNPKGERLIWVERRALDRLEALRALSEGYSDVILRLVELWA